MTADREAASLIYHISSADVLPIAPIRRLALASAER
jgi:hypothetical protein